MPNARAHGEAATKSVMARMNDSRKGMPNNGETMTTSAVRARTAGTKIRSNFSTVRWVGDFCTWASSTIFITRARVESLARRVTLTSSAPSPLTVPAKTLSPGALSMGMDSPVTGAWSTPEFPLKMTPSIGMRTPGRTMTRSSSWSDSTGSSCSFPSRRTRAVLGARSARAPTARRARSSARSSSACPRLNRNSSKAPSANSPRIAAPIAAITISRSVSNWRSRKACQA